MSTTPTKERRSRPIKAKIGRDLVLFMAGLGLTISESLRQGPERPTMLLLFAAMMGLPVVLRADEKRNKGSGG